MNIITNITDDMHNEFFRRTQLHIDLVCKNLTRFENYNNKTTLHILKLIGERHDFSKFSPELIGPYTKLTWCYYLKTPELLKYVDNNEEIKNAWKQHSQLEAHHPEYHKNCNDMSLFNLIEMVCDWTAISQELNQNNGSARNWFEFNLKLNKKWKFNKQKINLIDDLIFYLDTQNNLI